MKYRMEFRLLSGVTLKSAERESETETEMQESINALYENWEKLEKIRIYSVEGGVYVVSRDRIDYVSVTPVSCR